MTARIARHCSGDQPGQPHPLLERGRAYTDWSRWDGPGVEVSLAETLRNTDRCARASVELPCAGVNLVQRSVRRGLVVLTVHLCAFMRG